MTSSRSTRRDRSSRSQEHPPPAARDANAAGWRRFRLLAVVVVAGAAIITLAVTLLGRRVNESEDKEPSAAEMAKVNQPLPWPESPFANTREVTYVGSDKCIECHQAEHEGYRHTGMGRSLAKLDPSQEPPDAVVEHSLSRRRYEVVRRDGKMIHRELLLAADGRNVLLQEHPVSYVIGSGNHARGYLLAIDGFLVESPLTWYEARQAWDMSPGYDTPQQMGFQRPVDQGCLVCHVGRSQPLEGTFHRMQISQEWIGCERCHGPGSLHVEKQEGDSPALTRSLRDHPLPKGEGLGGTPIDRTIVNPKHLSRKLADDVCAQCHLRSVASSLIRGRDLADFRPGLPLSAVRTDFQFGKGNDPMSVVGHVQQMRASRCYQQSQMTCTTCHDPHAVPPREQQAEYYRGKCLSCHKLEDCHVDPAERSRTSADNNCLTCHMPRSPIDIPHLAFTHHRVGIHDLSKLGQPAEPLAEGEPPELVPLADLSSWSEADRARTLGSAYLELSQSKEGARWGKEYQQKSLDMLATAWEAGLREPDLGAKLAQFTSMAGDPRAIEFAEQVLSHENLPARLKGNALLAKADWHKRRGEFSLAADAARELTKLRRSASDWALVGEMEQKGGNQTAAVAAIEKAVEIDPLRVDLRRALADLYRREGNIEKARWHEERMP